MALVAQQVGAHHRGGGERNDHGDDDGGGKRDGELAEETANDSAHQEQGNKNGDERNADGEDGEADFFCALQRRGKRRQAVFQMTRDIFHHHDSVIHDEARGNGQSHERKIVNAEAEQIHHRAGADQRDRDGHGGNQRGARVAQKDEDHQDHQDNGNQQRLFDVADGGANGRGAVKHHGDFNPQRNRGLDEGKLRDDAVHCVDDVGAGLAEDDDGDGALPVQVAGSADVLHRVNHLRDVGKAHSGAILITDDDRPVVGRGGDLVVGQDVRGYDAVGNLAFGEVGILQAEHGLQIREGESVACQLRGIGFHADGGQRAASDADLADALYLRKLLHDDGGSDVIHFFGTVLIGGEAEDHDGRVGGIDFAIGGIGRQVGGQIRARGVDGGFDVARGAVDIATEIELNGDGGAAERAGGGHLRDAGNVAELALERSGDGRGHNFGAASGQTGTDGDGGEINFGQRRNRQHLECNCPGKRNRDGEQRGRDRAVNERRGDVHAGPGASALGVPGGCGLGASPPEVSCFGDLLEKRCARLSKKM